MSRIPLPLCVILLGTLGLTFGACTVSAAADCNSDDDCSADQYCMEGGGILAADGVCVDREVGIEPTDAGDTSYPDALNVDEPDTGEPDTDTGGQDTDTGDHDADAGPGDLCDDGEISGDQTDVDCGGPNCPGCSEGEQCTEDTDCATDACDDGTCVELPGAPTDVTAVRADEAADLEWLAPSDEGSSPITDYRVHVYDENGNDADGVSGDDDRMVGSADTELLFDGLTNDTKYTFRVQARNEHGFGPESEGLAGPIMPRPPFISTWNTANDGVSDDDQIELPLHSDGDYDFTVDWGDGNEDDITDAGQSETIHTYQSEGTYTVEIEGKLEGWRFNNQGDADKLEEIEQWGVLQPGDVDGSGSHFYGASNLKVSAQDTLDMRETTSMREMFAQCYSLEGIPRINEWDVSEVTTMQRMFSNVVDIGKSVPFNSDIGDWNTSSVTSMRSMFANADSFDQDLNEWDTSEVEDMGRMFTGAEQFDGAIEDWETSEVTDMSAMFNDAGSFDRDISDWDTSAVTNMSYMFSDAESFNQDIGGWDTSEVTNMEQMFASAQDFDQDLGDWDISKVTNIRFMFIGDGSLSTSNYDSLLVGWEAQDVHDDLEFHAGDSTYSPDSAAADARDNLESEYNWTILDGGEAE